MIKTKAKKKSETNRLIELLDNYKNHTAGNARETIKISEGTMQRKEWIVFST